MDYTELKVEIDTIPFEKHGLAANLSLLSQHSDYLASIVKVSDARAQSILDTVPPYVRTVVDRIRHNLDDQTDLFAWSARCLMELFFLLRNMFDSVEDFDEVVSEQLKDLKDLEKVFYPEGAPSPDAPADLQAFHSEMQAMWEALQTEYGIERDELKSTKKAFEYAKKAGLKDHYDHAWKILSKYVHPTAYLIFGKKSFVHSEDARRYCLVLAQFYAARILRDIHLMVQAAPS